jgi:Mn2+/Fe2+ NRAMP family transporter
VINGVISVPIMAVMVLMAARADVMGRFVVTRLLKRLGWMATGVMTVAVVAMFMTLS